MPGSSPGMKLVDAHIICSAVIPTGAVLNLWTVTDSGMVKSTPVGDYPTKGRGGAGVRCHRLGAKDTALVAATIVDSDPKHVGVNTAGASSKLPDAAGRRDGAGVKTEQLTRFARMR